MSDVNQGADVATKIVLAAVLLGILVLAMALIFGAVNTVSNSVNGYTNYVIVNESAYANTTGYTVSGVGVPGFTNPVLTQVFNSTSEAAIGLGNFTLSSAGVLTNKTSKFFDPIKISFTYSSTNSSINYAVNTGIQNNLLEMVVNFFSLMPTIGIILAVVVLIGVIVLLVLYVRRMAHKDQTSNFSG